jgi:protein SCO1/2
MRRIVAILACCVFSAAAHDVTKPAEGVALEQRPGAPIPASLAFVDDAGHATTFGDALHGRPAVLVLGYATCEDLCPLTLSGAERALRESGLAAGRDYAALFVSVDPHDGPAALAQARAHDIAFADRGAWTFLSGAGAKRLAESVGFRFRHDADPEAIAHAAGLVIVTPQPSVSRYFPGVRFDPSDVRLALTEAGQGRTGSVVDRLVLLCSHFDPATGRYTVTVLTILRAAIAGFAIAAAVFAWSVLRRRPAA